MSDQAKLAKELAKLAKQKRFTELHDAACARGEDSYPDPESGYEVFTRLKLLKAGKCCQSGCRHCPYGFKRP
jgi:hypothetical protein